MTGRQQPLPRMTSKIAGTQILTMASQPQTARQNSQRGLSLRSPKRKAIPTTQRTNRSPPPLLPRPSERRRPPSAEKRLTRPPLQLVPRTIYAHPFAVFLVTSIPVRLSCLTKSDSPTFRREKPVVLRSRSVPRFSPLRPSNKRRPLSTKMESGR